ncbi:MAG: DUF2336 domain-containing protein [Proteobacteria bacterium]|nr:DUF2336 domain-containing protein [Pseudomonadota bacterium]MBI3496486.1 DUF2336 domain-containing protein [Pseudomonadota bacterium]
MFDIISACGHPRPTEAATSEKDWVAGGKAWDLADFNQVLRLAQERRIKPRSAIAATVGGLYFAYGDALTERERTLMGDILTQLVHDTELQVRRALAQHLARQAGAPKNLILALANDEIEVALPVLLTSPELDDVALIEIVRHRTFAHQLAVALRPRLSEAVSEAIAATGSEPLMVALASNPGAVLSPELFQHLVEESKRIVVLQEPLVKRADLPVELARRLYGWVSETLRRVLIERWHLDPTLLGNAPWEPVEEPRQPESADMRATRLADELASRKALGPQLLIPTLQAGNVALFEAVLARLLRLEPAILRRIVYESPGECLAVAAKTIDLNAADFATLLGLVRGAHALGREIAQSEVPRVLRCFATLQPEGAREVVDGWRRTPSAGRPAAE